MDINIENTNLNRLDLKSCNVNNHSSAAGRNAWHGQLAHNHSQCYMHTLCHFLLFPTAISLTLSTKRQLLLQSAVN